MYKVCLAIVDHLTMTNVDSPRPDGRVFINKEEPNLHNHVGIKTVLSYVNIPSFMCSFVK